MRLTELTEIIKAGIESAGYVHGIYFGDVYEKWNNEQVKYVAFCTTLTQVRQMDGVKAYVFTMYAADKLLDDNSNETHAMDYAEGALDAALRHIDGADGVLEVISNRNYMPFVQKFADTVAGYWVEVEVHVEPTITPCE